MNDALPEDGRSRAEVSAEYIPFDVLSDFRQLFEELGPGAFQGDSEAQRHLVAELQRLARYRTVRDGDHEDVLQDVFMRMLEVIRVTRLDEELRREVRSLMEAGEGVPSARLQQVRNVLVSRASRYESLPLGRKLLDGILNAFEGEDPNDLSGWLNSPSIGASLYHDLQQAIREGDLEALRGYLKKAVWYKSGESNKRNKRRRKFEIQGNSLVENGDADKEGQSTSQGSPDQQLERAEDVERVKRAIEKLDERSQRIVQLFWTNGKSHREIAELLGITEIRSRQLLSRAKTRLKTLLAG